MKVLWFEITEPSGYSQNDNLVCGWQDALENILSKQEDIELSIAFESSKFDKPLTKGRINYFPLYLPKNLFNKVKSKFSWTYNSKRLISKMLGVIKEVKPDIIHIFGTEWPFGLVAKHTNIPTVIHIQGSIAECNKYTYPKKYSFINEAWASLPNILLASEILLKPIKDASRLSMEKKIWKANQNYMGRTQWDKNLSLSMNPHRNYFHVNEALRKEFIKTQYKWKFQNKGNISLISNGCGSFWKGPNILLKTAQLLKKRGLQFNWFVIGEMLPHLKPLIEKKEQTTFEENNVYFLGKQTAKQIQERMCNATFFIHCSYIDNSPNAICEAQCIGIPIISTNVGGIPSLIQDYKTGFLVPPNDPEKIAEKIIALHKDESTLTRISSESSIVAQERHNEKKILDDLLNCYRTILSKRK